MCERVPVIHEEEERTATGGGGGAATAAASSSSAADSVDQRTSMDVIAFESCDNCAMNRTDCSRRRQFSSSWTAATTTTEGSESGGKVIKTSKNKMDTKLTDSDSSISKSLLRLGAAATVSVPKRILSNPSLIIVLIVVLSNCLGVAKAKPLGSSRTAAGAGTGVGAGAAANLISISPEEWFSLEDGKVKLKRELLVAPQSSSSSSSSSSLKMDRIGSIGKETMDMLKVAIQQMRYQLNRYVDKIWSVKDIEAFEEMWGHEMNEFDWMGRTKSIEDIDNNDYIRELIELHERFQKISHGIEMIRQHNDLEMSPRPVAKEVGDSAQRNVRTVLQSLDEFYQALSEDGVAGLQDRTTVDATVNPNWDFGQGNRLIHHYVILSEFLKHLQFSNDVVQRFNEQRGAQNGDD